MNTRIEPNENVVPDPHSCSLDTNKIEKNNMDKDYEDLINCCHESILQICQTRSK
jgi:hypothetical protein